MRARAARIAAVCSPVLRALWLPGCPPRRRFGDVEFSASITVYSFSTFAYPLPAVAGIFDDDAVSRLRIAVLQLGCDLSQCCTGQHKPTDGIGDRHACVDRRVRMPDPRSKILHDLQGLTELRIEQRERSGRDRRRWWKRYRRPWRRFRLGACGGETVLVRFIVAYFERVAVVRCLALRHGGSLFGRTFRGLRICA